MMGPSSTPSDRWPELRGLDDAGFLARSRNLARGRTALVVSCGPSMGRWREVHAGLAAEQPLVLCVKQAVDEVGPLCDIHVFNAYNVQRYRYRGRRPLVVAGSGLDNAPLFEASDQRYSVVGGGPNSDLVRDTLAGALSFEAHELEQTGMARRPWGPGIMYEMVFPLLVHLGVTRIVTVGWDVADSDGRNSHFYDRAKSSPMPSRPLDPLSRLGRLLRRVPGVQVACSWLLRSLGRRYNPAPMAPGEAELIAASLPRLLSWLGDRGVDLKIETDSVWVSAQASAPGTGCEVRT